MQRIVKWLSILVFVGIACFIFFLVVTGRGETTPPAAVGGYEVRGADISSHNGEVDFAALARDSIEFVFIKATEGADFKDPRFHSNYRKARTNGIKTGAYHFFRFETPGYLQALNVMNTLRGKPVDLPVVIDVEQWTNPNDRHVSETVGRIREMADTLLAHGYEVMLYTNKDGYNRYIRGQLEEYPLWLCSFSNLEEAPHASFWQYSHRGIIRGVDRLVDMNVFCGTRAMWDSIHSRSRAGVTPLGWQ